MLYPFMTLEDETEIVHSEPLTVDGKEKVKVVIEQPVTGGFHSYGLYQLIEGTAKPQKYKLHKFSEKVQDVLPLLL